MPKCKILEKTVNELPYDCEFLSRDEAALRKRLPNVSLHSRESYSNHIINENDADELDNLNLGSARVSEEFELEKTESSDQFVAKLWEGAWKVYHFHHLPKWLQDNDFLLNGHRPPLKSFNACFRSIFRIHTETVNIWTHLLGCFIFAGIAAYFLLRPSESIPWNEKAVFATFFASVIICLGISTTFHIVCCHSEQVWRLFSKLDYCGIAVLITGSFIPWLYYGFYCDYQPKVFYFALVILLGAISIILSLWDKFSEPQFRWIRATVFASFGLSGVIPAIHFLVIYGFIPAINQAALGWICLMATLYLLGAAFYALRIPERFFPGKCDICFQSHQIFHVLVIAAAFVHYHGISEMAIHRLSAGSCNTGVNSY